MRRRKRSQSWIVLVVLGVAVALVPRSAAAADPSSGQTLPSGIPVLAPGGAGAASDLEAKLGCNPADPGKGVATLNWSVAQSAGGEQRVVLTVYRDGFSRGAFQASGPLSPGQASLAWEGLEPGVIHFWRVLTLQSGGWAPSEIASFEGPTCVANMVPGSAPRSP